MLQPRTIKDLVNAARTGEELAWNALHGSFSPGLYAIALRICKDILHAKDMVQDAFITAYLKLPQLKDDAAFGGWIKTILIHGCYRSLDQNKTYKSLDNVSDDWWEDQINQQFDRISTRSSLYTSIAVLPETLRSTLLLRYFSTFCSYEDIACILSIPIGTVRSRLNQAKSILHKRWEQHSDAGPQVSNENEEWNMFYQTTFSGIHHFHDCKNRFIGHLKKDMQVLLPDGKTNIGRQFFEYKINDDLKFGSWCQAANVLTSGNVSIIETNHFNSPDHPDHCPVNSVVVLYRDRGIAARMNLHIPSK